MSVITNCFSEFLSTDDANYDYFLIYFLFRDYYYYIISRYIIHVRISDVL